MLLNGTALTSVSFSKYFLLVFFVLTIEDRMLLFSKTHKEARLRGKMTMEHRVWHFLQHCPTDMLPRSKEMNTIFWSTKIRQETGLTAS